MGKKKKRKNPRPGVPSGLPHQSDEFVSSSRIFIRDYDRVRAETDIVDSFKSDQIREEALDRLSHIKEQEDRKYEIASFDSIVDFEPYYEVIANMKYDLEGLLLAIEGSFADNDKDAQELYQKYDLVLRKVKALVRSLKAL